MKTVFTLVVTLFIVSISFSQVEVGANLAFGSDSEIGIGAKARFGITEKIRVSPSINYYFGASAAIIGVNTSVFEVNADVHYDVAELNQFTFYPLAGLNYVSYSVEFLGVKKSENAIGANIGGGAIYEISDNFLAFAELKYVLSDYNQPVVSAGVLFRL